MAFKLSSNPDVNFDLETTLIAAVEIKTRTASNTIEELENTTKSIGNIAYCKINSDDSTTGDHFCQCIPKKADRQQVTLCCFPFFFNFFLIFFFLFFVFWFDY